MATFGNEIAIHRGVRRWDPEAKVWRGEGTNDEGSACSEQRTGDKEMPTHRSGKSFIRSSLLSEYDVKRSFYKSTDYLELFQGGTVCTPAAPL